MSKRVLMLAPVGVGKSRYWVPKWEFVDPQRAPGLLRQFVTTQQERNRVESFEATAPHGSIVRVGDVLFLAVDESKIEEAWKNIRYVPQTVTVTAPVVAAPVPVIAAPPPADEPEPPPVRRMPPVTPETKAENGKAEKSDSGGTILPGLFG